MFFAKLRPLPGADTLPDISEDYKGSRRVEKYRLGEKALYFPRGFSWEYLPLGNISEYRRVTRLIESENGVAPFSMEVPALRIFFCGRNEVLETEKEKNVLLLEDAFQAAAGRRD